MDAEMVRSGLQEAIPFNKHISLEVLEVGEGRGVVKLPDDPNLHNHVGSQHAAGLFAAGEAASGGAFAGVFYDKLAEVRPLAKSAEIESLKLGKGEITATAPLNEDRDELF